VVCWSSGLLTCRPSKWNGMMWGRFARATSSSVSASRTNRQTARPRRLGPRIYEPFGFAIAPRMRNKQRFAGEAALPLPDSSPRSVLHVDSHDPVQKPAIRSPDACCPHAAVALPRYQSSLMRGSSTLPGKLPPPWPCRRIWEGRYRSSRLLVNRRCPDRATVQGQAPPRWRRRGRHKGQ
jgi:hypothetical protein